MAFVAVVGWLSLFPDEFSQIGKHTAGGAAFISNLFYWLEAGYFDNIAETKPLIHLWSLGVEEQFYIIWPALLLITWKIKMDFFKLTLTIGLASLALSIYSTYAAPTAAFYSPLARFWELMAGGSLAYMLIHDRYLFRRYRTHQSVIGLILIILGMCLITKKSDFPGLLALLPVSGAFLLISAGPTAWVNKFILSNKILVSFGLISYPLYLWHWPLLSLLRIGNYDGTFRDVSAISRLLAIFIAITLSWITYKFIEMPIRFGDSKKMWTLALGASMAGMGVFGGLIFIKDGFPERIKLDPPTASILFRDYPHKQKNSACTRQYPEFESAWACMLSKPKEADVIIIGDSHANQYYQSLARKLPDSSVLNISDPGCLPFSTFPGCDKSLDKMIGFIKNNKSMKTVFLTGYFSFAAAGFEYGNIEGLRVAKNPTEKQKIEFQAAARKLLSVLVDSNKTIILIVDIPDLVFRPRTCVSFQNPIMAFLRGNVVRKKLDQCGISVKEFENRNQAHDELLRKILSEYPMVEIFNPRKLFDVGGMYTAYMNGGFLYWNSDHLTVEGADLVIEDFFLKHIALATCKHPQSDLQTSRFSTRINCE